MTSRTRPISLIRSGLTIIEIMIALTMTLIVLGAMMTAFGFASTQMRMGRAVMEMANRVRAVEDQLRTDLANLTVDPRPYTDTTPPNGYFEYVEGPRRDMDSLPPISADSINSYLGDVDDVIGMTCRSSGQLFRGRHNGGVIESSLAEIVWYTTLNDLNGDGVVEFNGDSVRVHRRVLLIRPELRTLASGLDNVDVNLFLASNDISCRVVSINAANDRFAIIANNLVDLSVRKNRFCHLIDPSNIGTAVPVHNFPNVLSRDLLDLRRSFDSTINDYTADDVMLTDVAGFNVRVYSPNASVNIESDIVVEPGDIGFVPDPSAPVLGAFVDLDHDGGGWFQNPLTADPTDTNPLRSYPYVVNGSQIGTLVESAYDTMTPLYESDGIDTDRDGSIDQGTNGLDDGGTSAPDDNFERETTAPYPYPIRGIEVSFRLIEKGTKQVFQSSVTHSYVPE